MKRSSIIVSILVLILSVFMVVSCSDAGKNKVVVLHAGSLSIPFQQMAEAFMAKYPEMKVELESHGSRTCARKIIDLDSRADVMASADSQVIKNLLMPDFAGYCIDFSTNEMVIMYTENSRYADEINSDNWFEILLRYDVQYGHSDPDADPCGYRTLLTYELAEKHYQKQGLANLLKSRMPQKNIRPKEVDLIALLEAMELDYIFIYRSVAEQHKKPYLVLPDAINLKSPYFKDFYNSVSVHISGKLPGEFIEMRGAPMVYGITLTKNARNPEWGAKFIAFVLGKEGQEIMSKNGQPEIVPPQVDQKDNLPPLLKEYF